MLPSPGSHPQIAVNESIRSIFADPNWMFKTGMGGVFTAASIVAVLYSLAGIPIMAALMALNTGYNLRVMRYQTSVHETKLPEWNDWLDLFLSGMTWIALQTSIWLLGGIIMLGIVILSSSYAYGLKSSTEALIFVVAGCLASSILLVLLSFSSSYLMVHFAHEENVQAGTAYVYVIKRLLEQPRHYFLVYAISTGLQWASIIVPILSVVGVFLIPSSVFAGQLASSALLANAWTKEKRLTEP